MVFRQGDNAKPMFDTNAQAGGPGNKAEKQAKSKRKKKPSQPRQLASNKRNTVSVRVVEPLSQVETNPPKVWLCLYL
jgi:hypothetical protein